MRDFTQILDKLQAETALVINYFAGFSRFEFALINSGIIIDRNEPNLHHPTADWIEFAERIEPHFNFQRTQDLSSAVTFLEADPPKRLSKVNGLIKWVDNDDVRRKTRLERLAVHVKTIRNNLFHGGEYPNAPQNPAERDADLLRSGIVMLEEFLVQSEPHVPDVRRFFDLAMPLPQGLP